MDMVDRPSWGWGLSLIVVTVAIHAMAIVIMAFMATKIRLRQKARRLSSWNLIVIMVCVIGAIGLLLAVLHGLECAIWAAAYLWLGALELAVGCLAVLGQFHDHAGCVRTDPATTLADDGGPGGRRRHVVVRREHSLHVRSDAGILDHARPTPECAQLAREPLISIRHCTDCCMRSGVSSLARHGFVGCCAPAKARSSFRQAI